MSARQGDGRVADGSRLRVRLAIALLVVAALSSLPGAVTRIRSLVASRSTSQDDLSRYMRRLRPVHDALLVDRIGYLPRSALRDHLGKVASDLPFLMTRYALAPTLVELDVNDRLVFADLSLEPEPADRNAMPEGFAVEEDFGDGLVLLRRTTP